MSNTRNNLDLSTWQVQPKPCRTCPFEGEDPLKLSPDRQCEVTEAIITLQSQHLCHSTRSSLAGRDTKLCRGARNLMLRVMCAKGLIGEATDAAFEAARKEVLGF